MRDEFPAKVRALPDSDPRGLYSFAGNLVFLSSSITFVSLLALHLGLRASADEWPPEASAPLPIALAAFATALIAGSSLTLEMGLREMRRARMPPVEGWLWAALLLALLFLASVGSLWARLLGEGFSSRNPHGGTFYVITAFHALHVFAGVGALCWALRGVRKGRLHLRNSVPLRLTARYWHVLGAHWGLIFVLLFLI